MFNKIIDFAKRYLFPPIYGKVVVALLTLAGAALAFSFAADTQFQAEGVIFGVSFSLVYDNKSSFWSGILLFISLVALAIWLFFRASSPPLPRSKRIAELEDAYLLRGNADSVCIHFREVHGVYVAPGELDDLMKKPETSVRARSLRIARSHVEFQPPLGFRLKSPNYPHHRLSTVFTVIYFVAVALCICFFMLTTAAIIASAHVVALQFFAAMVCLIFVGWSSLSAYSSCRNAIALTR